MTPEQIEAALAAVTDAAQQRWLTDARTAVRGDPVSIRARFPAVGRAVGRRRLSSDSGLACDWTVDDAARALLLVELGTDAGAALADLYRHGDAAEQRGILRALPLLVIGADAVWLVEDAVRSNDLRLIAAALGPYAAEHLNDAAYEQAVLKCVFTGISLSRVAGLSWRATPELARKLVHFAHERVAAGRDVPADIWPYVDRHPPAAELAALNAELDHPVAERRRAARAALDARAAVNV